MKRNIFLKKSISSLLTLVLIFTTFISIGNTTIANQTEKSFTEENPAFVEFELKPNAQKSSYVTASDGFNYYKVGDKIAVDVYVTTKNAKLSYLKVDTFSQDYQIKASKIEISQELANLNLGQYITTNVKANINSHDNYAEIIFDNQNISGVYLQDAIKLATVYYNVETASMHNTTEEHNKKLKIATTSSAKRDGKTLKTLNSEYYCYTADVPIDINVNCVKPTVKVGELVEITSSVYSSTDPSTHQPFTAKNLQDVVYTSSNPSILKVLPDGKIKAVGVGNAIITIKPLLNTTPELSQSINITVQDDANYVPVSGINIKDIPNTAVQLGENIELGASVSPANATDKTLYYKSSDNNVATISADGTIETMGVGTTTITISSVNNITKTFKLNVKNDIQKIEILNKIEAMDASGGSSYSLEVKVYPDDEQGSNKELVRYKVSDTKNATVEEITNATTGKTEYKLKNISGGPALVKVTAYIGDIEDSFLVSFVPHSSFKAITDFSITNAKEHMEVGATHTLETKIEPVDANNKLVNYFTSDESIATIDSNGNITALKEGNATITARIGNITKNYDLQVVASSVPINEIKLTLDGNEINNQTITLGTGEANAKTVSVTLGPDNTTEDKTFSVSSTDPNVASVHQEGNTITIQSYRVGTATVTVTHGDITASFNVKTVGIVFNSSNTTVEKGKTKKLEYTYVLEDSDEISTIEMVSSDSSIATVDENGVVSGINIDAYGNDGFAMITATLTTKNGKTYTADTYISVAILIKEITLNHSIIELEVGQDEYLSAKYTPTIVTERYNWYNTNEDVATIDNFGTVTAYKVGETIITAKSQSGVSASCTIIVTDRLHSDTTVYKAEASTCIKHGHEEYEVCNNCGIVVRGSNAELPLSDEHVGGTATCSKKAICELCGTEYGEVNSNNHENTEIRNKVEPTTKAEGYTGDTYCKDCGTLLKEGKAITKLEEEKEPENEPQDVPEKEENTDSQEEQKGEKDDTPKTGVNTAYVAAASLLAVISLGAIVVMKKVK